MQQGNDKDLLERVRMMATGTDDTWDLSDNDVAALSYVLERLASVEEDAEVWQGTLEDIIELTGAEGPSSIAALAVEGVQALKEQCNADLKQQAQNHLHYINAQQQIEDELKERLEKCEAALKFASHTSKCLALREVHKPGFNHYETDGNEPCPPYHFERGKCTCGYDAARVALEEK